MEPLISNPIIIGIAGNARSGKDTLGRNIKKILADNNIDSQILAFANELKNSVDSFLLEQTGISAFTEDDKEKQIIRPFLVCWGTEVMRKIDNNIWIEKLNKRLSFNKVNIITDLRFENELDWIKENSGFSILIKRSGIDPANDYEKTNNEKLEDVVDVKFEIGNFDDEKFIELAANEILNSLLDDKTFELWKATCH